MKLCLDVSEKDNARAETCLLFFPYHDRARRFNENKRLCTCCLLPRIEKCDIWKAHISRKEER